MTGRIQRKIDRVVAYASRRLRREQEAHGLVLMYHRVARVETDPWELCVRPEHFESQIQLLREYADLVPLAELRGQLRKGRRSRPAVAITFDDGYVDNLTVAKPVLQRFGAPATVFIATGQVGRKADFWWDRLAKLVLPERPLPSSLEIGAGPERFRYHDDRLTAGGDPGRRARRRLHDRIWEWCSNRPDSEREAVLAAVEQWADWHPAPDPASWAMTRDQLHALMAGGLVDIGAHSVTHPLLSRLPLDAKASEIRQSRIDCESLTGRAPAAFAFPNGDVDAESHTLVREAGFELACTSQPDLVWDAGDALATPRIHVGDENGTALLRRLRWFWLA
ncbi:MAG: polysaccharide deacetylase family protein [Steroidobacteraceae bacterium]